LGATYLLLVVGYAALAEHASLAAVATASSDHRRDLAAILRHGLSRSDAEMLEEQALLSLRGQLNDAQVLILMDFGNFMRTFGDEERKAFHELHSPRFELLPPDSGSSDDEIRRWTMFQHYESGLESLGLHGAAGA
jgi:hypothetical protein